MTRKIEAVVTSNGLNTFDFLTGNQKAFSAFDYAETHEKLQLNLLAITKRFGGKR